METESPFTDGDLTIQKLADKLAIPAPHLSQTINERYLRTNFFGGTQNKGRISTGIVLRFGKK